MGIPVSFPSAPLSVSDADNSLAEQILAAFGQVMGYGTTGSSVQTPPVLVPNSQVNATGVSGLQLTDPASQLAYRHMALVMAKVLGGSISQAQATANQAVNSNSQFSFSQTFEDFDPSKWVFRTGNASQVGVIQGGQKGGNALQATGYVWMEWGKNVVFDPNQLFRIRVRMKQTKDPSNGQKTMLVGLLGVGSDGTTIVNAVGQNDFSSPVFGVPIEQPATSGFAEYLFYWKGIAPTAAPGTTDPTNPGKLAVGTNYIRPVVIFNYNSGDGVQVLDVVEINVEPIDVAVAAASSAAAQAMSAAQSALKGISDAANAAASAAAAQFDASKGIKDAANAQVSANKGISDAANANANANSRALTNLSNVLAGSVTNSLIGNAAVAAANIGYSPGGGGNCVPNSGFLVDSNNDGTADSVSVYNGSAETATLSIGSPGPAIGTKYQRVSWAVGNTNVKGICFNSGDIKPSLQKDVWYTLSLKARASGTNVGQALDLAWNTPPSDKIAIANPLLTTSWQTYIFKIRWKYGTYGGYALWQANTVYPNWATVRLSDGTPLGSMASGGTSGATEPLGHVPGEAIVDGTVTWRQFPANEIFITITGSGTTGNLDFATVQMEQGEIATGWAPRVDELTAGAVTNTIIADGAITTQKIVALNITSSLLSTDAVTAGKVAANAIGAREIAAQSIFAKHLTVTNWDNLCLEPGFEDGGAQWAFDNLGSVVTGGRGPGTKCLQFNAGSGTNAVRNKNDIPCEQGQTYYAECWMDGTGMTTGGATIRLRGKDSSGAEVWNAAESAVSAPSGFTKVSITGVIPAGVATVNVEVVGRNPVGAAIKVDDIFLRRLNDGSLIVDGSISTSKIIAGAVTADKLQANAITAKSLTITNWDNLWPNPSSEEAIPTGYTPPGDGSDGQYDFIDATRAFSGTKSRLIAAGASEKDLLSPYIPCTQGDRFYVETQAYRASGTGQVGVYFSFYDATKTFLSSNGNGLNITGSYNSTTTGSWVKCQISADAPPGAVFVRAYCFAGANTTGSFDSMYFRRMADGNLIVDGSIVASKIAANQITANKLFIAAPGSALNADPGMIDSTAWQAYAANPTATFVTVTDGTVGNGVARNTSGSLAWMNGSKSIPIDSTKTYRVRAWMRTLSGTGATAYMGVALQDSAGANIAGDGGQWFYAASAVTPPTGWTLYTGTFGAGTAKTFPANARTMSPLFILGYNNGAAVHDIQDLRIEEVLPSTLIQDGSIISSKIFAGAVTADKVAANAITAQKLTLTNWDNLWPNANSEVPAPTGADTAIPSYTGGSITPASGSAEWYGITASASAYSGGFVRQLAATGASTITVLEHRIAANPGEQFYFEAYGKFISGAPGTGGGFNIEIDFFDKNGTVLLGAATTADQTASWAATPHFLTTAQAPAGTVSLSLRLLSRVAADGTSCTVQFDSIFAKKMAGANLIVDGSIIASKIQTNAVTADKIVANSITASKLTLSNFDNIWPNPGSESAPPTGADTGNSVYSASGSLTSGSAEFYGRFNAGASAYSGDWVRSISPTTANSFQTIEHRVSAAPGAQFYFEAQYKLASGASGTGGGAYLQITFLDKGGANLGQITTPYGNSATYTKLTLTAAVAPAGTTQVSFIIGGYAGTTSSTAVFYFDAMYCRRMADANLIVDGSVTATKVATDSIYAKNLVIGDLENLCLNPSADVDANGVLPSGWSEGVVGTLTCDTGATGLTGANRAMKAVDRNFYHGKWFPIAAGDEFYVSFDAQLITPAPPTLSSATPSATGGTIPAGTRYYVVTAVTPTGETVVSNELSAVTTGTTSSVALAWTAVTGATSYKVWYGTATGVYNNYWSLGNVTSYTDTNAASTAGSPKTGTTGGFSVGLSTATDAQLAGQAWLYPKDVPGTGTDQFALRATRGWQSVAGTIQIGLASTAKYARVWAQINDTAPFNQWWFRNVMVRRRNSSNLIVDGAITAKKISAGSITTDKLAVGAGRNMLYNSDFSQGFPTAANTTVGGMSVSLSGGTTLGSIGIGAAGASWSLNGSTDSRNVSSYNTPAIQQNNIVGNASAYLETAFPFIGVVPSKSYTFSIYTGAHRSKVDLYVYWYKSDGTVSTVRNLDYPNYATGADTVTGYANVNNAEAGGGQSITGFKRLYFNAVAPSDATQVRMFVRKWDTKAGNVDSYVFMCRAQIEECSDLGASATWSAQFQPSSWSPAPSTIIDQNGVTAAALKTSNYAEDGSGHPTAGAKLDSTGTAMKVAPGNLLLGKTNLDQTWFAKSWVMSVRFDYLFNVVAAFNSNGVFTGPVSSIEVRSSVIPPGVVASNLRAFVLTRTSDPRWELVECTPTGARPNTASIPQSNADGTVSVFVQLLDNNGVLQSSWPSIYSTVFVCFSTTGGFFM